MEFTQLMFEMTSYTSLVVEFKEVEVKLELELSLAIRLLYFFLILLLGVTFCGGN